MLKSRVKTSAKEDADSKETARARSLRVPALTQFKFRNTIIPDTVHSDAPNSITNNTDADTAQGVDEGQDRRETGLAPPLTRPVAVEQRRADFGARRMFCIDLPMWLLKAVPNERRLRIIAAAAIVGSRTNGLEIRRGQTSVDNPRQPRTMNFSRDEVEQLIVFGKQAKLVMYSSIIRTAIFAGFKIPGYQQGVISSPARDFKLSEQFCKELLAEANMLTQPEWLEAKKIPIEIRERNRPPWFIRLLAAPNVRCTGVRREDTYRKAM